MRRLYSPSGIILQIMIAGAFQEEAHLIAAFVADGADDIFGFCCDIFVDTYNAEIFFAAEP